MAWRYKGDAEVDVNDLDAFAVCDRCGVWTNHSKLRWQYQFAGTTVVNLRILVCPKCLDDMSPFLITPILPIDPPPVFNARPEPYFLDEVDVISSDETTGIEPSADAGGMATNNASENFSEPAGE